MKSPAHRNAHSTPLRVVSAALAMWLFILSLAGVSPALHAWLHTDANCEHPHSTHADTDSSQSSPEGHYCGVVALHSATTPVAAISLPERSDFQSIHYEIPSQRCTIKHIDQRLCARAPPVEILV